MLSYLTRFAPYLRRPRAGQLLAASTLLIGLVLAGSVTWNIVGSRQSDIDDALREMRNDALLLAEDEDRTLQAIDRVQRGLIEHMRERGIDTAEKYRLFVASRDAREILADRVVGLPYVIALSLFDPTGARLNGPPRPADDKADRTLIGELRASTARDLYIGEPSREYSDTPSREALTGQWTIHLGRRFETTDGRLIGFVTGAVQTRVFEQFYARLPLTGGGAFSLFRDDGMLLARYPHADPSIGHLFGETADFARMRASAGDDAIRHVSPLDGKDRLLVVRQLANFPLLIAVSDTVDSILASWWEESLALIATATVLELLIAGTMLLITGRLRGQERLRRAEAARVRAEADLVVVEERERAAHALHMRDLWFDTAVQHMVQGLLLVDHDKRVLVTNRRFNELCGLPAGIVTTGMSYADLARLVVSHGRIRTADMSELVRLRKESSRPEARATFVWELSDGRAFSVTHQPMEEGWLTTYEDITGQRAAQARIAHIAHHDALTGLPNRVLFRETLEFSLAFARRGHPLALHCLDLDQFKAINDTLGHPIGDRLLRAVATRLRHALRETDTIARLGGDEFAIIQTTIQTPRDATALAGGLIALLEAPFDIDGHQIVIGTSVGIALAPEDGLDADQLLKCADLAMYRAKAEDRGTYRLFHAEMDAAMQARRILETDLRQALCLGQLEVFYQPLIDVRGRRVAGCEALLRWHHPTMGAVPPDRFIPLAEETGLIVPIGEWVLRQACAAAAGWPGPLKVAVNLAAVQFKSPDLVGTVAAALRDSGLDPHRLELEITETTMLRDTDATLATLHQLHQLGIQIAMDDFGTGYSSLSYLRRFPFDRIKIDQSFVREMGLRAPGARDDCIAIVRAVTALGRDLGMEISAEGVETKEQVATLEQAGCTEIQGFLFSRAVPASVAIGLLRSMPAIAEVWPRAAADAPRRLEDVT